MKNISYIIIIFLSVAISSFISYSQPIPDDSLYLGQTLPGIIPKKFIFPVSQGLFAAERIAISHEGKEIYYNELNGYPPSISRIKYFKYSNSKWNGSFTLFENYGAPGLSIDGRTLFLEGGWQSVKSDTVWNTPLKFWNTSKKIHYLQATNSGNYYLTSNPVITKNGDISKLIINSTDTTAQSLGIPINSANNGVDFFISRDESFIIFVIQINQLGNLFISYHQPDGNWTNPKNLGLQINSPNAWEYGPYVTDDNKYLFFSRQSSTIDLYWVKVDNLIDSLKHTNFVPYPKSPIPDQTDTLGHLFNYRIPDSTFIDDDGNNTLTYSATLSNSTPLPPWLSFNPETKTFFGTPAEIGTYNIKVTATDAANISVSCSFKVIVAPLSGMADIFPLVVGTRWIYDYYWQYDNLSNPINNYCDTGTVTIQIIDKKVTSDSTCWLVQEDSKLWDQHNGGLWSPTGGIDTVELIELHQDRHRLYRTGTIEEVRHSVFPFLTNLVDTAMVFRYCPVDSVGVHSFESLENPPIVRYLFTFKQGVGESNVNIHDNCVCDWSFTGNHTLRSSNINGISSPQKELFVKNYNLFQNYPNPFNPTTTIRFNIVESGYYSLEVFNVLGQKVAQLINSELIAGIHTVNFDGSKLSSGLYTYKLIGNTVSMTKKMLLIK